MYKLPEIVIFIFKVAAGLYLFHLIRAVLTIVIVEVLQDDEISKWDLLSLKSYTNSLTKNKYIDLLLRIIFIGMVVIGGYFILMQYV